MKRNQIIVFLMALALAAGCRPGGNSNGSEAGNEQPAAALAFEQQHFSRQSAGCEQDSNYCARVEAIYPLAVAGPEQAVHRINDSIMAYLKVSLAVFAPSPEDIPETLDAVAGEFIEEYELAMAEEEGEMRTPWVVEVDGEVLNRPGKLVSIQLSTYSYAGGAHPNSFVYLINFDAQSGAALKLSDVVRDTARLRELAETAFREARGLSPDESLAEAGFFWGEDFALPENFALTEEGLYLFYNPYEAAAYAAGPTEFTIGREELSGLLKDDLGL